MNITRPQSRAEIDAVLNDPERTRAVRISIKGEAHPVREIVEKDGETFVRIWTSTRVPFERQLAPLDLSKCVICDYGSQPAPV